MSPDLYHCFDVMDHSVSGTPGATSTQAKIEALKEKFANFQSQWEEETRHRVDREGTKLDGVRESVLRLEGLISVETERRMDEQQSLQTTFESQVSSLIYRLEGIFMGRLDKLYTGIDALAQRMSAVEHDFAVTREKYIRDIEEKNSVFAKDTNDMLTAFTNEKASRKEREQLLTRKLLDHQASTKIAMETQSSLREDKYQTLRSELEEIKAVREKGDQIFQNLTLEEIATVKNGAAAESSAREQADDDIVQALNHYTKCLHDALKIINQH